MEFGGGIFPGWIRPGLIEATRTACRARRCRPSFPGWIRPGLIEALEMSACPSFCEVFPGWIRPGLIEALHTKYRRTLDLPFPGWIRPGLIEARAATWTASSTTGLSGVDPPRPH